ncbi:unnamed protein product [Chondrus crispus]|uniref:Uncharacterized protein n=1 Tax=Chondrus crispus TaxID=2769 RepID=R7Q1Z3_CHOCR|nr:unnamed protein product [Chondrus crispus]CDF32602.1 unnamed protein product [Chondrus crispus]|eukprot:XP_005712373.1 unnamed protein product [Chondrus crispus]
MKDKLVHGQSAIQTGSHIILRRAMLEHCPQPVVKRRIKSATGEEDEDEDLGADILCSYCKASVFALSKNSAAV